VSSCATHWAGIGECVQDATVTMLGRRYVTPCRRAIGRASHAVTLMCVHRAPGLVGSIRMQTPGVQIEIVHDPIHSMPAQTERACAIAHALNRGKAVLVERSER
jgi:hypothetical protein